MMPPNELQSAVRATIVADEEKEMRKKAPKAKKPAPKPPTFIEAFRAALKPVRKKSKRNRVNGVNSGRMSCSALDAYDWVEGRGLDDARAKLRQELAKHQLQKT